MANYNDSRLTQVEEDKKVALDNLEELYGGMIESSDKFYQDQIDASKNWAEQQQKIQQEQTDFTLQQIEQQKEQAQQNYQKEQTAAYTDWKKQSNQYGAEAEKMAAAGLAGTGYSESSQVRMYNAYQQRVATAKQSIDQALTNFTNSMTSARIQNNAALAQIAATAFQKQLELSLQGFQYKNSLQLQKEETRQNYENTYYQRYLSVLDQINTERALAQQAAARQAAIEEQDNALAQLTTYGLLSAAEDFNGSYSDAVSILKQYGKSDRIGGIMNNREWNSHGRKNGTYTAYLAAYLEKVAMDG